MGHAILHPMKRYRRTLIILVVIGVVAAGAWYGYPRLFPAFPMASGDTVSTWTFAGPYADGGEKEAQVKAEITRLSQELGKGTYTDYDLLVGIATQHELLGNGKEAYDYLSRAIRKDAKKGIAYFNLGHLMEGLGAYQTAGRAYKKATESEPDVVAYRLAFDAFVSRHPDIEL